MRVGANFCPGILHAVPAKDGLLLRIRVPGGLIHPSQLSTIAGLSNAFCDGQVEITSRANIQLRAIRIQDHAQVVEGLATAGLLPSGEHDRVRNIIASPFAGLDAEELLDTVPFVEELDDRLSKDSELAKLHPKFSLALNGSGRWFSRESDDLAMQAVDIEGKIYFHLAIGGMPTGLSATTDRVVDSMLEAARICLRIARQFDIPVRGKTIAAVPDALSHTLQSLSNFMIPCPLPVGSAVETEVPIGVIQTKRAGVVNIVPSVPLGRLQAGHAWSMSDIADRCGSGLRLAPWRGIVLSAVPEYLVSKVMARLMEAGLSFDGRDGYRGLAACAGSDGCDASLADVRALAASLAGRLANRDTQPGWTVNISGCEKQCAMRKGATAELVAIESGYSMRLHGTPVASCCSAADAMDAIVACHANFSAKAYA